MRKHKEEERKRITAQKEAAKTTPAIFDKPKKPKGESSLPSTSAQPVSLREDTKQKRAPKEKRTPNRDFKVKAKAVSQAKK